MNIMDMAGVDLRVIDHAWIYNQCVCGVEHLTLITTKYEYYNYMQACLISKLSIDIITLVDLINYSVRAIE